MDVTRPCAKDNGVALSCIGPIVSIQGTSDLTGTAMAKKVRVKETRADCHITKYLSNSSGAGDRCLPDDM